jgi:hypothetical protein
LYQAGKHQPASLRVRATRRAPAKLALIAAGLTAALLTAGCGNEYRPVVSAINTVGPAGQPTKYAVAVSNPNSSGLTSVSGYSIANNVITVYLSGANPFSVGDVVSLSGFPFSSYLNGRSLTVLPSGFSSAQFQANLIHANGSATETGSAAVQGGISGLVTYVDFAGDTTLSTPNVLTNPNYFAITDAGSEGYVVNSASSLNYFALTNPTAILTSDVGQTTLKAGSDPLSINAVIPYGSTETLFIPEANTGNVDVLSGSTTALLQELSVGANPVYVVGSDNAPRVYAISEGDGTTPSTISSLEATTTSSLAVTATIPVGINPVYGVMTADDRRAFILNEGSGNVSVVNVVNNALDSATPTITIPPIATAGGGSTAPNPIWADLSAVSDQFVVLNRGDGVHPGTLNIFNVPLCNAAAQPTNPNCNSANPVDATGFGTLAGTATVGINPIMVSVLHDGTYAYVINQLDSTGTCATGQGSVSVVNLVSGVTTSTICGVASGTTSDGYIHGHPNSVSATTGDPTGKVYVTAADSTDLSVIYTETNTVQTHITLQGLGVRVLVTSP